MTQIPHLRSRRIGFLLTGLLCVSLELQAQETIIRSDPKRTEVISFLDLEAMPMPVQVETPVIIGEMPPVTITSQAVPLPPWVRAGQPWIETEALEIHSVVGQWVELTNPEALLFPDAEATEPTTVSEATVSLWIYLPTGKTYAPLKDLQVYRWLKADTSQPEDPDAVSP